jgi:hypothetical protein
MKTVRGSLPLAIGLAWAWAGACTYGYMTGFFS